MTKVFVGLSGGVDSSVAASLLAEQGYQVTGVYMKNWSQDLPGMVCPWAEDLADAKRVAVKLGIDLKVYDFETEYRQKVVDYMLAEYQAGRTPNPDVMCNQEIKFKLFLNTALADGADMIATGHYAQIGNLAADSNVCLLQAKDAKKDQTYFLYRVTKQALAKTLFPLGDLLKTEVRQIAKDRGLVTAAKKDSVGICFVGQVGIEEFLTEFVDFKPGPIIDIDSKKQVGLHKGAVLYTIGQRHGLDVGGGMPYYVIDKNIAENTVYVSQKLTNPKLWLKEISVIDSHWINDLPEVGQSYQVRNRHLGKLETATLVALDAKTAKFKLGQPIRAVTLGQSLVAYDGQVCLGGGIIN